MLFKLYKNYEKTKIIYLILKFLSSIINNYKKTDFNEHHIKVYFKISGFHEREKRIFILYLCPDLARMV